MLIELNGLSFHLRIAFCGPTSTLEASIVDEAFSHDVMKRPVFGTDCVRKLIEDYVGFIPTPSQMAHISQKFPRSLSQAA